MRKEIKDRPRDKKSDEAGKIVKELTEAYNHVGRPEHMPETLVFVQNQSGEMTEIAQVYTEDAEAFDKKSNQNLAKKMSFYITMSKRDLELVESLTADEYKLLGYLKAKIYLNSRIYGFTVLDTYKKVGMTYEKCRRAFNGLTDRKLVFKSSEKASKKGGGLILILDPTISFKGTFTNQYKAVVQFHDHMTRQKDKARMKTDA